MVVKSLVCFGLVYVISTIVGYLMPNHLYTHTFNILNLVWFGLVYVISTIVGYLMPNHLYTHTFNILNLVWFGLVLCHINHCWLFNAKSSLYTYI